MAEPVGTPLFEQGETDSLESTLAGLEASVGESIQANDGVAKHLKKLRAAAASGHLKNLASVSQQLLPMLDSLHRSVRAVTGQVEMTTSYPMSPDAYIQELLTEMERAGLKPRWQDGIVFCYPSMIRVSPRDKTIEIDNKKEMSIRPKHVAAQMVKHCSKAAGTPPDRFINILHEAYILVHAAQGEVSKAVPLVAVHRALTLLPKSKDYTIHEFARDIVALDVSTVNATPNGWNMVLLGSTGTKTAAAITSVTPDGEVRAYWGVEFQKC